MGLYVEFSVGIPIYLVVWSAQLIMKEPRASWHVLEVD